MLQYKRPSAQQVLDSPVKALPSGGCPTNSHRFPMLLSELVAAVDFLFYECLWEFSFGHVAADFGSLVPLDKTWHK